MEKETVLKIEHMNIVFTQYDRGMHQTELPVIRNLDVGEFCPITPAWEEISSIWERNLPKKG